MDIQKIHVVLASASSEGGTWEPVRRWAEREGATLVRMLGRTNEFSDELRSRTARDSAFLLGMREALVIAEGMDEGLLVVDVTGLQTDQVNRLTNALDKTSIPLDKVVLEGCEWPVTSVVIPPQIMDPWPAVDGYDIVGDVHGCIDELSDLLRILGCTETDRGWEAAPGRRIVFVGDMVDRGPDPVAVLDLVAGMCRSGNALCVAGNHDWHLRGFLNGDKIKVSPVHGMEDTKTAVRLLSEERREDIRGFLRGLPHQLLLDEGRLVVAHAGCPARLQGLLSKGAARECMFGVMNGRNDDGTPERLDWAAYYSGDAVVVQGHTPVVVPVETSGTWNIDTGCVFGNSLTALKWPSIEFVSVQARRDYTDGHVTAQRLAAEREELPVRNIHY